MDNYDDNALLTLVWSNGLFDHVNIATTTGDAIKIIAHGTPDQSGNITGATVAIGGTLCKGDVVIVCDSAERVCRSSVILAVPRSARISCSYSDGLPVPVLVVPIEAALEAKYRSLLEWSDSGVCGAEIRQYETQERRELLSTLLAERLGRKYNQLLEIHREGEGDWNYTLYLMAFRAMAGPRNKDSFLALARSVPYKALLAERGSPLAVEALLLGTAGLLHSRDEEAENDDYMRELSREFDMLRNKYGIAVMDTSVWDGGSFPNGSPSLRLAQLASFFTNRDFILGKVLECRSCDDLYPIFCTPASDYWSTHYDLGRESLPHGKSIGHEKAESMGINMVVPLMFAYGKENGEEQLQLSALQLLEAIPCESNYITKKWDGSGTPMENAFDTQAIIQLNNEYCYRRRCAECRIGRRALALEYLGTKGVVLRN